MTSTRLFRAPRAPGEVWRRRRTGALIQFISRDADGRYVFDNLTEPQYRRTSESSRELSEGEFAADFLADSLADAFARGMIVAVEPGQPREQADALLALAVAAARVFNQHGKDQEGEEWRALERAIAESLPWTLKDETPETPRVTTERVQDAAREVIEHLRPLYETYLAPPRDATKKTTARPADRPLITPEDLARGVRFLRELTKKSR